MSEKQLELDFDKVIVWPSSKIRYAYLEANYWRKQGTIGSSCMRSKRNQKALNFYVKNNVKIVVIVDKKNKVKSRALLWENVKVEGKVRPITYLDRVYYSEEKQKDIYKLFAEKNKYKSYNYNGIDSNIFIPNIDIKGITHLPYTDTFRRLYWKDLILSKSNYATKHNDYISLTQTVDGGYTWELDPNNTVEALTRNRISKKDAVFVKQYGGWVSKKNVVKIDTVYYSSADTKIIQCSDNTYCLKSEATQEEFTGGWINKKDSIKIQKYRGYVSKNNIIEINGEQYHKRDTEVVNYEDKFYIKKHCYNNNGVYFPKHKAFITSDIKENCGDIYIVDAKYIPDNNNNYIELNTGEFIEDNEENKRYLIRRNGKVYLKYLYKSKTKTEKNQLKFAFKD